MNIEQAINEVSTSTNQIINELKEYINEQAKNPLWGFTKLCTLTNENSAVTFDPVNLFGKEIAIVVSSDATLYSSGTALAYITLFGEGLLITIYFENTEGSSTSTTAPGDVDNLLLKWNPFSGISTILDGTLSITQYGTDNRIVITERSTNTTSCAATARNFFSLESYSIDIYYK